MLIFESSRYGKTLTLVIGPDAQQFTVHADRLTKISEYFRIALQGEWKEAQDDTFTLAEENASVFGLFIEWLYDPHLKYTRTDDSFRFLVEAYLLGERRGVGAFRNLIISEINKCWPKNAFSCMAIYNLVFTETTEESKLRHLIIDHVVWEGRLEDLQAGAKKGEAMHPELAMALYAGLLGRVRPGFQSPRYEPCSSGDPLHRFRCDKKGCGKNPELAHTQDDVAYLAPVTNAPYRAYFCTTYHEHKPGEVTTVGGLVTSCNTRLRS